MPTFNLAKSYSEIAEKTTNRLTRELFISEALVAIREAGFDRVRHYEVTEDIAAKRTVAILICEDDESAGHAGFHASSIARSSSGKLVITPQRLSLRRRIML
jgi:hypothetical protein